MRENENSITGNNSSETNKVSDSINDFNNMLHTSELDKLEQTGFKSKILPKPESKLEELPNSFKEILLEKEIKEYKSELPYIVGYKGFRRGVKSGNYYGQNFIDTSLSAKKDIINNTTFA